MSETSPMSIAQWLAQGRRLPALSVRPKGVRSRVRSVVEIGAQSLKVHRLGEGVITTSKLPSTIGRDVYATGLISEATVRRLAGSIAENDLRGAVVIGTSAMRDAENQKAVVQFLEKELRLGVLVLTPWEEASLLAEGYLVAHRMLPALVADLGGGSLQIVYLAKTRALLWDSLAVGAVRVHELARRDGARAEEGRIDAEFKRATLIHHSQVHVTGGTTKAVARVLRKTVFSPTELEALELSVREKGPPAELRFERARVFRAGVSVLRRLAAAVRAESIRYIDLSIGRVFLELIRSTQARWEQSDPPPGRRQVIPMASGAFPAPSVGGAPSA